MIDDLYKEHLVDSPDDIEKVIEGGEDKAYESGRESGNEDQKSDEEKNKENEDDKDKKTKVRRKFGPRLVLNAERLNGPRGIGVMESFFSDLKLYGKGREKEDLEVVMKRLEHWAHRLAPRMHFDDCLKKIEKLGSKKEVANKVKRIRLDLDVEDDVVRDDAADNAPDSPPPPDDPFDQLMSSSVAAPPITEMTAEQREQMLRNRLLAEERRAARIKKAQEMKLKFQERLNSQTVDTQSVDLPEPEVEVQPENKNEVEDVAKSVNDTKTDTSSDNVRISDTVNQQTEENCSLEEAEFERKLDDVDDSQMDIAVEKEINACEVADVNDRIFHESETELEEIQPVLEAPTS